MALHDLPTELILHIAHFLDYASEINSLAQTNHHLFAILDRLLYTSHAQEPDNGGGSSSSLALQWAAARGSEPALLKLLATGGQPSLEAMLLAATFGHERIVALLHDRGVDVNGQGRAAWPPGFSVEETDYEEECRGTPLWRAVKRGRENVVRFLLDRGADVQFSMSEDGYTREETLMGLAAREGNAVVMGMLIEASRRRKSLNLAPESMIVWLVDAIERGNAALARVLVDAGCGVNGAAAVSPAPPALPPPPRSFPSRLRSPPMLMAASVGSIEIVETLLGAGASPSSRDVFDGSTPVDTAARSGHAEIVQYLLDMGSRPSVAGLFSLLHGNRRDMFELLVPWIDLAQMTADDDEYAQATLLTAAAGFGLLSLVTDLLSRGWNANGTTAADSPGRRGRGMGDIRIPLVRAAWHGHLDVFQLLLEHGADPFYLSCAGADDDDDGQRSGTSIILQAAVTGGNAEIVSYLLTRGADCKTTTADGESLLLYALQNAPVFKLLLDHGADPTVRDVDNNPLASAVIRCGTPDIVRLLCEHEHERGSIDFPSLRTFVPENGGDIPDHELSLLALLAEAAGGMPVVHTLLEHGGLGLGLGLGLNLNPSATTDPRANDSALSAAVRHANIPYLRFLLSHGFNPRATPALQAHLLCDAASLGDAEQAAEMLDVLTQQAGLAIDAQNARARTALLHAIVGEWVNAPAHAVPLLLARGADPLFRNPAGECPLKGACVVRDSGALEALLGAVEEEEEEARQISWERVEAQLREAMEILSGDRDLRFECDVKSLRVLRRVYWRRRYPCS